MRIKHFLGLFSLECAKPGPVSSLLFHCSVLITCSSLSNNNDSSFWVVCLWEKLQSYLQLTILITLEPLISQTILLDRNLLEWNGNKFFWKTVISMQMINNWIEKNMLKSLTNYSKQKLNYSRYGSKKVLWNIVIVWTSNIRFSSPNRCMWIFKHFLMYQFQPFLIERRQSPT